MIRCAAPNRYPAAMQACSNFEEAAPVLNFRILRILIRILEFSSMHRPRQWHSLISPSCFNGYADGTTTCGNDARQGFYLQRLSSPSTLLFRAKYSATWPIPYKLYLTITREGSSRAIIIWTTIGVVGIDYEKKPDMFWLKDQGTCQMKCIVLVRVASAKYRKHRDPKPIMGGNSGLEYRYEFRPSSWWWKKERSRSLSRSWAIDWFICGNMGLAPWHG